LEKLEKVVGRAPCSICRDWWKGPVVIRDDTDLPVYRDPDVCPSCGQKRPEGLILEIVICEQIVAAKVGKYSNPGPQDAPWGNLGETNAGTGRG
jgi:hypothetical protein